MIEVRGISKSFGQVDALSDVSFTVDKGHVVGFLGVNGAGKTTAMDIICGCIGADQGEVFVDGYEISLSPKKVKQNLGYLPDIPPLHNDMKVYEYLSYVANLRGVASSNIKSRIGRLEEKLSLGDVRDRLIGNLSKGFKQRVGLAQALIHDPEVLVLDEPTEGLDPNQIVQIRELINSLKKEHTIIFSSHILSEVESICDEVIIIDKGRIVETGVYDQLVAKLEAGRNYKLGVGKHAEMLVQDLAKIEGVVDPRVVDVERNIIEFNTNMDEIIVELVARRVIDGGYGLKEISLKSKSLKMSSLGLPERYSVIWKVYFL